MLRRTDSNRRSPGSYPGEITTSPPRERGVPSGGGPLTRLIRGPQAASHRAARNKAPVHGSPGTGPASPVPRPPDETPFAGARQAPGPCWGRRMNLEVRVGFEPAMINGGCSSAPSTTRPPHRKTEARGLVSRAGLAVRDLCSGVPSPIFRRDHRGGLVEQAAFCLAARNARRVDPAGFGRVATPALAPLRPDRVGDHYHLSGRRRTACDGYQLLRAHLSRAGPVNAPVSIRGRRRARNHARACPHRAQTNAR